MSSTPQWWALVSIAAAGLAALLTRPDRFNAPSRSPLATPLVIAIVLVALGAALTVVGSPFAVDAAS